MSERGKRKAGKWLLELTFVLTRISPLLGYFVTVNSIPQYYCCTL